MQEWPRCRPVIASSKLNSGMLRPKADCGGFGFLVPRSEGLRLLGTVWNSSLFPGRAPDGMASFTSFLGRHDRSRNRLLRPGTHRRHRALGTLLRSGHKRSAGRAARFALGARLAAIQYRPSRRTVAALRELCAKTPGIFLAGNYLAGPSLGACVEHANEVADLAASLHLLQPRRQPSAR